MKRPKDRISVVGMGFVGLALASVSAGRGFHTIGVDIDGKKTDRLRAGRPDFFEPGMAATLRRSIESKRLHFTTDLDYAVRNSEITFLTVGTPQKDGGAEIDLSCVKNASDAIALSLKGKGTFHLLVVKSTVPPRTTENLILPAFEDLIRSGRMDIAVNPEFLSEGSAINDLLKPSLIVIGSKRRRSPILERYYGDFYKTPPEIEHTDIATAEMIKYAYNALLATKISFINSIGNLCQEIPGCDVDVVARAIGKDPKIGPSFLQAGPGFGGSCLPKDLAGLIGFSQGIGTNPDLFKAVKEANDRQFLAIPRIMEEQGALAEGNTVAVLGLAFKGNTDDVREAVSVRVVERLLEHNLKIKVHDPTAMENFGRIFGARVSYSASVGECLEGSDCCVILTDWNEYRMLERADFLVMRSRNIIDARRILDAGKFQGMNFRAIGLGR